MLDRTIPFYNTLLKCTSYKPCEAKLPEGYSIVTYRDGYDEDWARLECAIEDFSTIDEALEYFRETYVSADRDEDIFFALNPDGKAVGACMAWTDDRMGEKVNSLHWLVVDEAEQRKGLGRALCVTVMNRFYEKNGERVYIHTQPWSWKAILLYISLGFRLQKSDSFSHYENQYPYAMTALSSVLDEETMKYLSASSDE